MEPEKSLTQFTISDLRTTAQKLRQLVAAIDRYIDSGGPFTTCCRLDGVDWSAARRVIQSQSVKQLTIDPIYGQLPPPGQDGLGTGVEQLYADVFGIPISKIGSFTLPKDADVTVDYVLGALSERCQQVIRACYGLDDGELMDDAEVGKEFGVTRERVRQLRAKGIRQLAHPNRSKILKMGLAEWRQIQDAQERLEEVKRKERERLQAENEKLATLQVRAEYYKTGEVTGWLESDGIETLDLSIRSYNCLKRAGINTVGELLATPDDKLRTVRNLGNRSCMEIQAKLQDRETAIRSQLLAEQMLKETPSEETAQETTQEET